MYQIVRSPTAFDFYIYDSPSKNVYGYREIKSVHFYADTSDYIFLITINNDCYSVEKKTGTVYSMSFDVVPSTEEKVCFINLLNEKQSHLSRDY